MNRRSFIKCAGFTILPGGLFNWKRIWVSHLHIKEIYEIDGKIGWCDIQLDVRNGKLDLMEVHRELGCDNMEEARNEKNCFERFIRRREEKGFRRDHHIVDYPMDAPLLTQEESDMLWKDMNAGKIAIRSYDKFMPGWRREVAKSAWMYNWDAEAPKTTFISDEPTAVPFSKQDNDNALEDAIKHRILTGQHDPILG